MELELARLQLSSSTVSFVLSGSEHSVPTCIRTFPLDLFVRAKERFQGVQRMEYALLDVSPDPVEQGFGLGSYDLIIATNARTFCCNTIFEANMRHATPSLQETLVNFR